MCVCVCGRPGLHGKRRNKHARTTRMLPIERGHEDMYSFGGRGLEISSVSQQRLFSEGAAHHPATALPVSINQLQPCQPASTSYSPAS